MILSLITMYNWDNTLFDGLKPRLPSFIKGNMSEVDRIAFADPSFDVLISNLLFECSELETIYSDPDIMKQAIGIWAMKQEHVWQQMYNTTLYRYNAIWNKDGVIKRTETENRNLQRKESGTDSNSNNEKEIKTNSTTGKDVISNTQKTDSTGNTMLTHSVAGYNSETMVSSYTDKNDVTGSENVKNDGEVSVNKEENGSITRDGSGNSQHQNNVNDSGSITRTYEDREQGNIGVTMTQQMIEAERKITLNIYDYIIRDFMQRFCLLVY